MYIPNQHLHILHKQMLAEALEGTDPQAPRSPKPPRAERQRRVLRVPALLMVKLGRSLEGVGLAYLEDRQQCSA
jgi:hypothetical protein